MVFEEIVRRLQETFVLQDINLSGNEEIVDISLFDYQMRTWNEGTLYVGTLAGSVDFPDHPVSFFSTERPGNIPPGSQYALFRPNDLCTLFNQTKEMIYEESRQNDRYFRLLRTASSGLNLHSLINEAASFMGNALILIDANERVLAHSTNMEIMDPLWQQNIERGYCDFSFIQLVRANKSMLQWSKSGGETQAITLPGDLQPKLVARLLNDGHVQGALIMIAHHQPITSNSERMLPLVGKLLLDSYYRDSKELTTHRSSYSSLFYELLDEQDPVQFDAAIARSLPLPDTLQVVVARYIRPIENRYIKRTFALAMEEIFPEGHTVQYKSYVAIVVDAISDTQRLALEDLAQKEQVRIGISWPFHQLNDFRRHFNQAVSTIKQAQRFQDQKLVIDYTDYASYDLFFNYTGKQALVEYCHPALQKLSAFDQETNSALYRTLQVYLEQDKNLHETAKALFIHRNTLSYRLNKICELTGLDLKRPGTTYALLSSYLLERFLRAEAGSLRE